MSRAISQIEEIAADWVVRRKSGLTSGEEADFAAWRAADPRHADAVGRHETAWAILDRQRTRGLADPMVQQLRRRSSTRRRHRLGAYSAVLALVLGGIVWRVHDRPPVAASSSVVVPEKRMLPDGSVVELKAGTQITVDFSGPYRRVSLAEGQALFQVAKDRNRPFVVAVAGMEVRAVGTAFLVNLNGPNVDVVVTEGRVQVAKADEVRKPGMDSARTLALRAPVFLSAGQSMTIDVANARPQPPQPSRVSTEELAQRLAWRAPWVEFNDMPIADAVALMNRGSLAQISIEDRGIAAVHVNGLFRAGDSENFVRLLESNFGVKAERTGNRVILRKAN